MVHEVMHGVRCKGKCVIQLCEQEQIGTVGFELNCERKVGFRKTKDKKVFSREEVFQCEESELRTSDMDREKPSQMLAFRIIHQDGLKPIQHIYRAGVYTEEHNMAVPTVKNFNTGNKTIK